MKKISLRNKIIAILIIMAIIFGGFVSIKGIKGHNLKKDLKYGLDINGGVYVLLEADTNEKGTDLQKTMNQTKSVLENRVNSMGISEAQVSIEGTNRLRVELPGVEDADEAIKQIGRTAQLKFLLADGTEVLTGEGVKDSQLATDSENGGYKITIDFTADGSDKFAKGTETAAAGTVTPTLTDETGNPVSATSIVIMLDDEIISAPTVSQKINSLSCEITRPGGGFEEEEASTLSALIRGGALPVNLTEINSSVQTATIGADALDVSIKAGAIGLGLVLIIMFLCYGLLGIIADLALILYVQIVLWTMVGMGSVLTLPGIAGIILSIGMAVDSNVIIFTRIKEEIQKDKPVKTAVDTGYHAALTTVIDAQTTTLIAAIVLYAFGTTSVKGFALTLMIGTVVSVITAVFITQLFVKILAESKFGTNKNFGLNEDGSSRLKTKFNFNFIDNRKKFYAISLCVIIIGLGFTAFKGFNYGIDFTGGTMIQLDMGKEVKINEVKDTIADFDLNPTIVYAGKDNKQIIIRTIKDLKTADREEVVNVLSDKYNLKEDAVLASEEFGPTVGKDLKQNATKAIFLAAIMMLIYIRFRFKTWKYGLAAVSGLIHDILVTLSIYAIFNITINNPFIAGILTVVGYSINDTIVVFDRIRENSKFYKKKQNKELINDSLNQTLSRTIVTSLTTLIVMLPLFFMASSELKSFLIPLIIGVFVGTYSSVFLCSPLFYELTKNDNISKYERNLLKEQKAKSHGIMK